MASRQTEQRTEALKNKLNNREKCIFSRRLSKNVGFSVEIHVMHLVFGLRSIFLIARTK